jgi:hypothetical protein
MLDKLGTGDAAAEVGEEALVFRGHWFDLALLDLPASL